MATPGNALSDDENLRAEYQANIALWQHDDSLRQERSGTFLTVTTVLLSALAAVTALEAPLRYLGVIAVVFSAFGATVCRVWYLVQARNGEYVRFRRFQLRSIEARLPGLTTFRHIHEAFYTGEEVEFAGVDGRFRVAAAARRSSTASEGLLPVLVGVMWLAVGVAGVVVALATWGKGA